MKKLFTDVPGWLQAALALLLALIASIIYMTGISSDLQAEIVERKTTDQFISEGVKDIKDMLKEEMERHHPRKP